MHLLEVAFFWLLHIGEIIIFFEVIMMFHFLARLLGLNLSYVWTLLFVEMSF